MPITAGMALKTYIAGLSDFEKGEILDYKTVYTIGSPESKIQASLLKKPNCGYDDDQGDYKIIEGDHLGY
jgi:dual specificity tyrosine-phosphorylation-regulated kinase 2/3/4